MGKKKGLGLSKKPRLTGLLEHISHWKKGPTETLSFS